MEKETLTASEAMGVAMSIPMGATEMGECQRLAPGVLEHLGKLGYELVRLPENDLRKSIEGALNRACAENASNTPDWVLAEFLLGCLRSFDRCVRERDRWYGIDAKPGGSRILREEERDEKPPRS